MKECHVASYDENTGKGLVRHVLIRYGFSTKELMVCVIINGNSLPKVEKLIDRLEILAWVMICVAMVAWIGYSAYAKVTAKEASIVKETVVDTSAIDNYVSGLSADTQ